MTPANDQVGGGGLLSPALERWRNRKVAAFIPDGSRVLDLGCGRAALLRTLLAKGKRAVQYVGVDRAAAVIEANRADFPDQTFLARDLTGGVGDLAAPSTPSRSSLWSNTWKTPNFCSPRFDDVCARAAGCSSRLLVEAAKESTPPASASVYSAGPPMRSTPRSSRIETS